MFSARLMIIMTGYLLYANALFAFNRQDTLRGNNGTGRSWWDVQYYDLTFSIDTLRRSISGCNTVQFKVPDTEYDSLQIDLQEPMQLDSAVLSNGFKIAFQREGNVYWLDFGFARERPQSYYTLKLFFHGQPRTAVKAPWDGGFIWTKDSLGNAWMSVACQGLGASAWWPCKDYQGDEPDYGMRLYSPSLDMDDQMNGRAHMDTVFSDVQDASSVPLIRNYWEIVNPINTYDVSFYAGQYTHWVDTFMGLKGVLTLYFAPLVYHEQAARSHFQQVKQMLRAFEYWLGPYPFYEDGYKIVEAPFLGMEHQSGIAYGNEYKMGYLGKDRSGTGVGLLFDFIIVHESGHEWFGNSITAADIADNWIHEGFTTYTEALFAEYWLGKEKAFTYTRGEWKNISNDRPVIGHYGVNDAGSGDKYDKGSALVHTIRLLMDDDQRFRALLHCMQDTFYHRQISSRQMEDFIQRFTGLDLESVFEQYLRTTMIPELQWYRQGKTLFYRFDKIVEDFTLPVPLRINDQEEILQVDSSWQILEMESSRDSLVFPDTFLIRIRNIR